MTQNADPTSNPLTTENPSNTPITVQTEHGQKFELQPIAFDDASAQILKWQSQRKLVWLAKELLEIEPTLERVTIDIGYDVEINEEGTHFSSWYMHLEGTDDFETNEELQAFVLDANTTVSSSVLAFWFNADDQPNGKLKIDLQAVINNPPPNRHLYFATLA